MKHYLRTQRFVLVGALAALLAVVAWIVVASRGDGDHSGDHDGSGQATGAMVGMEGMAGMDMSTDGSVQLSANQIRQFGVTFGTADVRTLEDRIRTTGVVTFDETRIAQVTLKFGGFVERLRVDFTGQPVRRGQPLLDIYSPELVAAQEELLVARRLERTMDQSSVPGVPVGASNLLAAATRRLRLWDISEEQIERILASGEVQRTLTLHAPASGVVVTDNLPEGRRPVTLSLDGVKAVDAFDRRFVLVAVHAIAGRNVTRLAGTTVSDESTDRAAILATLQATDRWVRGHLE